MNDMVPFLAGEVFILAVLTRAVQNKIFKIWAASIGAVIFAYLLIPNPNSFEVSAGSILNGYFYMYLPAIILFLLSALFCKKEEGASEWFKNGGNIYFIFAAALFFVFANIEIAAFFAKDGRINYSLDNTFGQDMCHTLCWGIFALAMFVFAIFKKIKTVRIIGIVLLMIASSKLFLHDIFVLGPVYKIISCFGLAGMLILVSFLYQKYISKSNDQKICEF